ncbi:MAG TPA: glycine cleavage T C-terminal barrel domain-containing protein [Vicinamibacterales bacterium]|jgi:folate-binding protein YgfZ|nr:glycine cleavage T C-terminal barrel domain-containing protein [Vicinamibacterales bacterium]
MLATVSRKAYDAARREAAYINRSNRGRIVVTGPDRATYLQGLLTNDIVALQAGTGCYAAYLTPQGRMITDLLVYELGDAILLNVPGEVTDALVSRLDQFVFTEDVRLGNVTDTFAQYAVIGPGAATAMATLIQASPELVAALGAHGNLRAALLDHPVIIARESDTGEPGFDLFLDRTDAAMFEERLQQAGVVQLDEATADAIRIEQGVPLFHRDMDEETIPLEAGIEGRALSLTKGCYVGQEVIIRVLHRGHGRVARKLVGLLLEGSEAPPAGTTVRSGEREIGRVTSAALSPALGRPIALGYVQRDFVEPGTPVVVGDTPAVVNRLPFVPLSA